MIDERFRLVAEAGQAVRYQLHDVAHKIVLVIENNAWQEFTLPTKRVVHHDTFESFLRAKAPDGLATDIETVRRICRDAPQFLDIIDRALQRPTGRPKETGNNVPNIQRPPGNTAQKALRRLRKDRPDLHARVLAQELSPHAAALEAGHRRRYVSVRSDDLGSAFRTLSKYFPHRSDVLAAVDEVWPPKSNDKD